MRTREELKDEEAPADMIEHLVPQEAPRFVATLCHVQDCVPPHHLRHVHSMLSTFGALHCLSERYLLPVFTYTMLYSKCP